MIGDNLFLFLMVRFVMTPCIEIIFWVVRVLSRTVNRLVVLWKDYLIAWRAASV